MQILAPQTLSFLHSFNFGKSIGSFHHSFHHSEIKIWIKKLFVSWKHVRFLKHLWMMSERPFHWRTLRILFDFSYVTGATKYIYIYIYIYICSNSKVNWHANDPVSSPNCLDRWIRRLTKRLWATLNPKFISQHIEAIHEKFTER